MNNISLDAIWLYIQVVQKGSFLEASKSLQQSHVTLNRQITALEATLGKALLIRSSTGIKATDFGNELILRVKARYDALLENIQLSFDSNSSRDKPIKILLSSGMSYFFLEALYPQLITLMSLKIEISTYNTRFIELNYEHLKSMLNVFDCIIIEGRHQYLIADTHWIVIKSRFGRLKLYASEAYINGNGAPESLEEIKSHNCLYINQGYKNNITLFNQQDKPFYVQIKGDFGSDVIEHITEMTVAGYGIGLVPEIFINKFLKSPLVPVLPEYFGGIYEVLTLRNLNSNHPSINEFSQALKTSLENLKI